MTAPPADVCDLILGEAGSGRHHGSCELPPASLAASGGLKMAESNKRMHATADTTAVMLQQ
jgi:hypothetical protein